MCGPHALHHDNQDDRHLDNVLGDHMTSKRANQMALRISHQLHGSLGGGWLHITGGGSEVLPTQKGERRHKIHAMLKRWGDRRRQNHFYDSFEAGHLGFNHTEMGGGARCPPRLRGCGGGWLNHVLRGAKNVRNLIFTLFNCQ